MTPPTPAPQNGLNAAVAAEIRAEQARMRLTTQALADLADIPYGSLRRYLNAERNIDVGVLAALAVALETTPSALVEQAEKNLPRFAAERSGLQWARFIADQTGSEWGRAVVELGRLRAQKQISDELYPRVEAALYEMTAVDGGVADLAARDEDQEK